MFGTTEKVGINKFISSSVTLERRLLIKNKKYC